MITPYQHFCVHLFISYDEEARKEYTQKQLEVYITSLEQLVSNFLDLIKALLLMFAVTWVGSEVFTVHLLGGVRQCDSFYFSSCKVGFFILKKWGAARVITSTS